MIMSRKSKEVTKGSKFIRYMKVSIKFFTRARDFYIQTMTQCSAMAGYGSAMGCPTGQIGSGLPRSFSSSSSASNSSTNVNEDYREVLGLSKARGHEMVVRRSCSVGVRVGRIDEDKPCVFGEDDDVLNLYPRSRSYAPRRTRSGF